MQPLLSAQAFPPVQRRQYPNDVAATGASALPLSAVPPASSGAQAADVPLPATPVYQPGNFGDVVTIPVVFAAAGTLLALARPSSGIRKLLIINNTIPGFTIAVGFDLQPAGILGGLQINNNGVTAGNLFFDAVVPQNDIWIFSPAAGTIQVSYMIDNTIKG